jgi:hypothetical protein
MATPPESEAGPTPASTSSSASALPLPIRRLNVGQKGEGSHPATEFESWSQTTTVLVGESRTKFIVHTNHLRKVPFFRGCLDANMIEKSEESVSLPEDIPEAFGCVVTWLYTGCLPSNIEALRKEAATKANATQLNEYLEVYHLCLYTYVMAQKLLLEALQNKLMDIIRTTLLQKSITGIQAAYLVSSVPANDKILVLLKQEISASVKLNGGWAAWKEKSTLYTHFSARYVEYLEFTADALATYRAGTRTAPMSRSCDYHVHIDTPKCQT